MSEYIISDGEIYTNLSGKLEITGMPTERIIRCRDCKHRREDDGASFDSPLWCSQHGCKVPHSGFCHLGDDGFESKEES